MSTNTNLNVTRSFWAKKAGARRNKCNFVVNELWKQWKESAAAPFHYLSPRTFAAWSMLTHWTRHFPPMDLMDPDALAGNGSNAIWRDWRGPLTDRQVAALWTPFYPSSHSSAAPCWREFSMQENNSSWRIDPSWIYSRSGSARKSYLSLSLWIYRNAVATIFLRLLHAMKKGCETLAEIKFADKFSQVFSASRVRG